MPAAALPEAVLSPSVEHLGSIQQDVGLTTGAKVVGNRMFVTSGKNISIYDMSDPGAPRPLGAMKANVGGVDIVQGPGRAVPQAGNGVCVDGEPVAGALGCSVHWFHEHPSFADGGLVAIGADGSITEEGYFLPLGSPSSSPRWRARTTSSTRSTTTSCAGSARTTCRDRVTSRGSARHRG